VTEFGIRSVPGFVGLAAFLAILHSFLEEYYWRWFVHAFLRNWLPFVPAALISGYAFTAHHVFVLDVYFPDRLWSAVVPFSLGIAFGGIVWAWIYERSGSLLGPWLSHLIVDAAVMAVGYDIMFGN
jgi:membrane protease YdiL (CAAX protease family)